MEMPGLMQMVHAAAAHAAERQSHIARNVANADTPGYRATDVASFAETLRGGADIALKRTRPTHLDAGRDSGAYHTMERDTEASPNGNTVSLEREMMESAVAQNQHQTALSIYASARDILSASLGRGR